MRAFVMLVALASVARAYPWDAPPGPPSLASVDEFSARPDEPVEERAAGRKSPLLAAGLSILVPGGGQLYLGDGARGGVYLGLEAATWTAFALFRVYAHWKDDDYRGYAALHSGSRVEGKSDEYMEDLTYYDNTDDFNDWALWNTGDPANMYPTDEEWFWDWDGDASRAHYRDLRNDAKRARRRSLNMIGVAALLRVVSAVDAFRGARAHNSRLEREGFGWRVRPEYDASEDRIGLSLTARF